MKKKLVIVESPAKAKTIHKYLERSYTVEATIGHIKNLPKSSLGVDIENNFEPSFKTIRGKGDTVAKIKKLASQSDIIYIATDPDREGEAIAQDIADIITSSKKKTIHRVLFNEITKKAVKQAILEPREIDSHLVNSQRARRVMDRIIGYQVSPLLWKAIIEEATNSLSSGRVQSVALRLVCERETAILNFIPTEYWNIKAAFITDSQKTLYSKLYSVDRKEVRIPPKPLMSDEDWLNFNERFTAISTHKEAQELLRRIRSSEPFIISDISKKQSRKNPSPPFITSTMQAEASRVLRLRPRQTMAVAQQLYEGIDLGKEGTVGLITYMRTDSTRLSDEIVSEARTFITETFGGEFCPPAPNKFIKKKGQTVQDAHEAIRPTSLQYTPEFVRPFLSDQQWKLYQLIWRRFIACQMAPAIVETTTVDLSGGVFLFRTSGQTILFPGFLKLYDDDEETTDSQNNENDPDAPESIPAYLEVKQQLSLDDLQSIQSSTNPPPRYTESSLIKELESNGIGRPSTFASIVGTVVDRNYVVVKEKKIFPTELGSRVNDLLMLHFSAIFNVSFTAQMEEELDQIAQGEKEYIEVLHDFYDPFANILHKVESEIEKIPCPICKSGEMLIKFGRFGKFLGCSNYPECTNMMSLREFVQSKQEPEYTGDTCPQCGARSVLREGRFGKFIGCEKFPECTFTKNLTTGITCPKCKTAEIVEKRSRKNRIFYGCGSYPNCDFVSWKKPVPVPCKNCDYSFMEEHYSAKKGSFLKCPICKDEVLLPSKEHEE